MRISIPRERKTLEKRVALTPSDAKILSSQGHQISIETHAGAGSFFSDQDYKDAGCTILNSLEETWASADLLVKVKEPAPEEFSFFRPNLHIFTFLHLAGLPEVAKALLNSKTTGIAYELVTTEVDGRLRFPILAPMSQIAGKLSVQNAAHYLLTQNKGRGVLLGGTNKVAAGKVVILGAGVAGQAACEIALGMGANVSILDINEPLLATVKNNLGSYGKLTCIKSTPENLFSELKNCDALISAVLIPGAKAPKLITREHLKAMPSGSVLVDISIDQGGSLEGIHTTSLAEPVYTEEDVLIYAVPNMPSQVARTSTESLTAETMPYILSMANNGFEKALQTPELKAAICTQNGQITNSAVAEALRI